MYLFVGLVKLCMFGFFFAGQLVDFLLILTQVMSLYHYGHAYNIIPAVSLLQCITPADHSDYYIPFFGPLIHQLTDNNETFFDS